MLNLIVEHFRDITEPFLTLDFLKFSSCPYLPARIWIRQTFEPGLDPDAYGNIALYRERLKMYIFAVLWNRNATPCLSRTGKSQLKKCEANSLGINNGSDIQKARFCKEIVLGDCAKCCLDPELEPEPDPKLKSLNRNRNK
jgi:hypothetical protein